MILRSLVILMDALASVAAPAIVTDALARRRGTVIEPSVLVDLVGYGLGGVEVDHPNHLPADRELLRGLAAEHGLLATGSSDYHGTGKIDHELGSLLTTPQALDRLLGGGVTDRG